MTEELTRPLSVIEVENIVLGSVLISPILPDIIPALIPEDFYSDRNQNIFRACQSLHERGEGIDLITVFQECKALGTPVPASELADLTNRVSSTSHINSHAAIVKEYSIRRQIMFGFGECCRNAADEMHDVFEVLNQSELILSDIKTGIIRNRRSNKQDVLNKLIESMKNIESIGIGLTGMSEVDRVIGRAEPGDMILVAGRPGMGKSMLANTMARHVGIEQGLKTLFWALEMTSMQNLRRQISNVGNLDYGYLKRAEVDYPAFDKATQIILSSALEYEDRTGVTAMDVRSRLISQQRLTGLNFAIVDHGGLLNNMNTRNNNEVTEISKTTKLLKQTAKDLNIPIVVLWQLNREVEKRAGCVPKISDLRDSGSLEQDADKIIFIYRPEYYGINQYTIGEDTYETKGLAVAMVEKNREGEPGRALMRFNPWNMRFEAWQGENSKATSDIPF